MRRSMLCEPPVTHPTKLRGVPPVQQADNTHEHSNGDESADDDQHRCARPYRHGTDTILTALAIRVCSVRHTQWPVPATRLESKDQI